MPVFIPFQAHKLPGGDMPLVTWLEIIERKPLKRGLIGVTLEDEDGKSVTPPPGSLLVAPGDNIFKVMDKPEYKPYVVLRPKGNSRLPKDHIKLDMSPRPTDTW
jgi:hypothetical protein